MANRKLGRPTDQRMAMLRNQVTNLIWYGKIETTLARGKEVQSLAEHIITIAMPICRPAQFILRTTLRNGLYLSHFPKKQQTLRRD